MHLRAALLRLFTVVALTCFLSTIVHSQVLVDCTGADVTAYPSINAALTANTGPVTMLVTGPCSEYLWIQGRTGITIGAAWGQTVTITGQIVILESQSIYLYGLKVTNPWGSGFDIESSHGIVMDSCTSSNNYDVGMYVGNHANVIIQGTSAFNSNASGGLDIGGNSYVAAYLYDATLDISNNSGPGIFLASGSFSTLGNTKISGNTTNPSRPGFGIDARGGSHVQFGTIFGANLISGNEMGGVSLQELTEASFWNGIGYPNTIQFNGPVGILAGYSSQVTFYDSVQIVDHTGPAVDLFAKSQGYFFGANQISRNGNVSDPAGAAIRADGNSEVFLRGGNISQNIGPGILALVNSSVDFTGLTFSGNTGGLITCDPTATMVSDLAGPNTTPPAGVRCKVPHALGNRKIAKLVPKAPNFAVYKVMQARYKSMATRKPK